ncbi:uncharacterized protein K460DRAFT_410051 [Cucurbitaria berberidis CBS 394.84]|uniref:Uncharacterized protein n=1 Tax=Cucurbitaria berberidis CBS 394.84 TaxID=1168544 RepID=A0A9P4L3Q5_9PLEO|nr:uncharacterized protein K460DRAFT_410051 [Cucurbitaria berberidis CBS 394.84]KAF1840635.1 hypothetical protein K460DRAFT_410051 [Cucurbitaria berberidis CBS 394.84]
MTASCRNLSTSVLIRNNISFPEDRVNTYGIFKQADRNLWAEDASPGDQGILWVENTPHAATRTRKRSRAEFDGEEGGVGEMDEGIGGAIRVRLHGTDNENVTSLGGNVPDGDITDAELEIVRIELTNDRKKEEQQNGAAYDSLGARRANRIQLERQCINEYLRSNLQVAAEQCFPKIPAPPLENLYTEQKKDVISAHALVELTR